MSIHELAWKGRFIVTQDGHVDLPPDRQSIIGPTEATDRKAFIAKLNAAFPQAKLFDAIRTRLVSREIYTSEAKEVVLFDGPHEGDQWLVKGNSNGSYGYFYVEARIV